MLVLAVAFILMGVLEIYVMIQVASVIGAIATVLAIVLCSAVGAWVVKLQGFGASRRIAGAVAEGRMPTSELIDAFLVLLAGTLLLVPGFVSGAFGLLLAVPPIRAGFRAPINSIVQNRVSRRMRVVGTVFDQAGNARGARFGTSGAGMGYGPGGARRPGPGDSEDIIDLDSEEVFIDEPQGELPGGHEQ